MEIGDRLKWIRSELKKTQEDIRKDLNISLQTLINYERGTTNIPSNVIQALADLYDVNPTWLITGKEDPFSEDSIPRFFRKACKDPELEIIIEELENSPKTKRAILKVIKTQKASERALEELQDSFKKDEVID